ncbi:hypothetical protein G3A43_06950 [Paraburkholderia aspalathi]|nr:hypothetical protein [Paraburkholderia aspalathi]MBK3779989.1 hypothetical protein [Paraburkholderia aspalathi]
MKTIHCCACQHDLPETEFAIKNKATGLRRTKCKPCQRAYAKRHYAENLKEYVKRATVRNRQVKDAYRAILEPLLADGVCVCCGVKSGSLVDGKPSRLVFTRKHGFTGAPVHDVLREKLGQAVFDEALRNSELKCDACAFTPYVEHIKPTQFGTAGATVLRGHRGGAQFSILARRA